jgi:transcriptional regulator with PAS, ATPase and Fis domain
MRSLYHQIRALLKGDIRVLITGETGVGKEQVARMLHASSLRASGPFEAVNCAAIPTELLEVELFGVEAGVATGVTARVGRMVAAAGGVIFLDEIGEMSPALQAKLLRVLEEKSAHPVGARRPIPLDVRIISATNCDLRARIHDGRFRPDLYYRIAGYTLEVPPLRERRDDIPTLVEHFIRQFASEVGTGVHGISVKALRALEQGSWPGNVRELAFEVRRLVYLCPAGQAITSSLLSPHLLSRASEPTAAHARDDGDLSERRHKDELDRRLIAEALERAGGRKAEAAKLLQLSPYGLRKMMRRLGLTP